MVGCAQSLTPKDEAISLLKLERSPSHSWWWDSHKSPRNSKWLESNLQDLDDKVKQMLRLIEEDADSFAQRAEMYYQKRPELVNLVEEFYRAYRSLAERYDYLKGEIRQNVPRALQVQYGLSCDSPNGIDATGGRHRYCHSPLRKSNQQFENLLKKSCQIDDPSKDVDQVRNTIEILPNKFNKIGDDITLQNHNDSFVESSSSSSDKEESLLSPSDSEVDNVTPYEQLQLEVKELQEKNKLLAESEKQTLDINHALQSKMQDLERDFKLKEKEMNDLKARVDEFNAEAECFSVMSVLKHDVHETQADQVPADSLLAKSSAQKGHDETSKGCCVPCRPDGLHLEANIMHEQRITPFNLIQDEVGSLKEENRMQRLVILERGEEKREVIRQLSISMEMLKCENQRLQVALSWSRKRLQVCDAAAGLRVSRSSFTSWKQLFALVGFKTCQPFVAVAL